MAGQKGRSGRRPDPKSARQLRGTDRTDRSVPSIQLPAGFPLPPDDLPDESQQEWLRIAPALAAAGLLTEADWIAWEMGFRVYAMWREAITELQDAPKVEMSEKGGLYQHPLVAIEKGYWERTLKFCKEFGLTPNSRRGLTIDQPSGPVDPLEGMLNG